MPPPSPENDLKRRARRRLIGAVALTLLAVIVLPLLLEDEPPPTSSLAVKMAATPRQPASPAQMGKPDMADTGVPPAPAESQPEPTAIPEPQARPVKPAPVKPTPKPSSTQAAAPTAPPAKPAAASAGFVVQLAALSDDAKASELKARAAESGLPVYTDTVGKLTRVRVGPFPSREAAVAAAVKLAENGMAGQVVAK